MRYDDDPLAHRDVSTMPLFAPPRARASDPATSHDAAASMAHAAGVQRALILNVLTERGAMTADELDQALDFRPSTSGRRMVELLDLRQVEFTGGTRPTRSGRAANIYRRVT